MKEKIAERIARAIQESVFPGCVVGYVVPGAGKEVLAFGTQTYDDSSPKIRENSIFDVASLTKAIPTSSLALLFLDRGILRLEDPVIRYVPQIKGSFREQILLRHLLTHTLEFKLRLSSLKNSGPDGILNAIYSSELAHPPATTYFYSNATSILLGLVIERVSGKNLAELADEEFFKPLAMNRTSFFCDSFDKSDIVPSEIDAWRGRTIRGEVHDESAWVLRSERVVGSAGLFSTAPDILKFLEMLLGCGVAQGKKYFSTDILRQMQTNQIRNLGKHTGLGWELFQPRYMGKYCAEKTLGKTGFTGCVCVCDMERQTGFVFLSNYTFPTRKPDTQLIDSVRRDVADIIFSQA